MGNKSLRLTPVRAAIAGLALAALPMASFAYVSVGVSITVGPPALPVYVQPPCPAVGYIWTPGYWAWDDGDYYWVPGTWVLAPSPGLLWTPGYWGWGEGVYLWHAGYWGPHVGFYGGVNYGFGYGGVGFEGGYWNHGAFYYNRSVSNINNINVTNVYNKTVINNVNVTRVSYNGGEGGLQARPTSSELVAEHDHHVPFTAAQREQEHTAFGNHDLRASVNGGKPRIAATERPGVFTGKGIVAARAAGAPYHGGGDHAAGAAGAGRGPDVHAVNRAGNQAVGSAGHGEAAHVASRNDRPPGAAGSAEVRGGTGGGAFSHGGPGGNASHAAELHAGNTAGRAPELRNDRPPGATGAATHGGSIPGGGGAAAGRGAESHTAGGNGHSESSRVAMAHNDFARGANTHGGPSGVPNGGAIHNEPARAPQQHYNQENQMHSMPQQGPRPGGSAQPTPHQFNGGGFGGGQPHPQPQAAPRPQPMPQRMPQPEIHRGGEPHGQGQPQPQMRGGPHEENHGRR